MSTEKKCEILSPAGSLNALYAGIYAGADAVYIGGQKFGARAYAENPENTDLLRAMDYVHMQDKKIYLTVNTLLKNQEIENQLYDYLLPFYKNGLDAVIVQDLGVFQFIKEAFPKMEIHASTQMAITGVESAKLLKNMGASRVVTARELSLAELQEIHENVDVEIESFIHGAMCYSYSGMCLFSSIIGGRSGNRGRCAGPCRQPYEVYQNGIRRNDKNSLYALSLKDMNTIEIIPQILNAGVFSLKIEGRMKSPEYAAGVVSIYRKYVDLYLEKGEEFYQVAKKDYENLMNLYSRSGSTTGYYECHNSKNMISVSKPAYQTKNEAFTEQIKNLYCDKKKKKRVMAEMVLIPDEPMQLKLFDDNYQVVVEGDMVSRAMKRPIDEENVRKQLNKTGDSLIEFQDVQIKMGADVFVPVSQLNEIRRNAVTKFEDLVLDSWKRERNEVLSSKENNVGFQGNEHEARTFGCQVCTIEQLETVLEYQEIQDVYVATDFFSLQECANVVNKIQNAGKNSYVNLPFVLRKQGKDYVNRLLELLDGKALTFSVKNVDELAFFINRGYDNFVVDNSLYAFNQYAKEFYYAQSNTKRITLPYELNFKELKRLADSRDELVLYGRIPLMISAGCVKKNFDKCQKAETAKLLENNRKAEKNLKTGINESGMVLKDRLGADFLVMNCCNFCYNIVYNNVPLSLLGVHQKIKQLPMKHLRLNFTTESGVQAKDILEKYIQVFCRDGEADELEAFTRGHFNRGVE